MTVEEKLKRLGQCVMVMSKPTARARVRMLVRVQEILTTELFVMPDCPEKEERRELIAEVGDLRGLIEGSLGRDG